MLYLLIKREEVEMELLNLTPHTVKVVGRDGEVEIPASGLLVRVGTEEKERGEYLYDGKALPVVRQTLKDLQILKDGKPLTKEEIKEVFKDVYGVIVSSVVAQFSEDLRKLVGNFDLKVFTPNTAKAIRDEQGRIVGVPSLVEWD